ncbi:MAG: HAMP domain-containing sensor histidine kinase [Myxococcales bacterium]|nr:HAMP domain-containing histidine kinase [Polyangiaceae bacterium]MDW8248892.1 HAMP domain-containing sensor histidine kinase [Myxococcales bacterium]
MRLLTRLALSQVAPLGLIGAALLVTVGSVVRLTGSIGELRTDLDTMRQEHGLHQAAWALDVALRQVEDGCERGEDPRELARRLTEHTEQVEAVLRKAVASRPSLREAAEHYRDFARKKLAHGLCQQTLGRAAIREEQRLDEQLTDAWLVETQSLHHSMVAREEEARRLSEQATWAGGIAVVLSAVMLVVAARSVARSVTDPLQTLAGAARRIGEGDFSREIATGGPHEVAALATELDGMRQQLAKLEQLKQSFLASISHELRTPLAKLREALALLGDGATGPLTDRQRRVVQIARDACERQIRMVSTLLELSRLRAGTPLQIQAGTTLDQVIEAAVEYERDDAQVKGVPIHVERQGELPTMSLDGPLMERAIANLIRNAVSVSPQGEPVRLSREVRRTDPDGREGSWVQIRVQDRGPGVRKDVRTQLFTPFVSHEVPSASRPAGIGLGLALSREIIRAHGGELRLEDHEPPGATFSIWLPLPKPNVTPANTCS